MSSYVDEPGCQNSSYLLSVSCEVSIRVIGIVSGANGGVQDALSTRTWLFIKSAICRLSESMYLVHYLDIIIIVVLIKALCVMSED